MLIALAVAAIAAAPPALPPRADRAAPAPRCRAAGRFQTSVEPALLFRKQDRASAQAKKLIDLPDGEKCLVERAEK